jgi:hypothetical protein
MQVKKRNAFVILLSLLLIVGAAGSFPAPHADALAAAQSNGNQSRTTRMKAPRTEKQSTTVTSTDRHIACTRGCEEKYSGCLAAKKAKGWDPDRAEKMCGLSGRSCKKGCDR